MFLLILVCVNMLASAHLYLFIYRNCPQIIVNRHYVQENTVYDFKPLPWCKWYLCSFGMYFFNCCM